MSEATTALENWLHKEKCRSYRIEHDAGYGASCHCVVLRRGNSEVVCPEVNFIGERRIEKDGNLFCAVIDGDSGEDWPGLEKTILFALECAEQFWDEP